MADDDETVPERNYAHQPLPSIDGVQGNEHDLFVEAEGEFVQSRNRERRSAAKEWRIAGLAVAFGLFIVVLIVTRNNHDTVKPLDCELKYTWNKGWEDYLDTIYKLDNWSERGNSTLVSPARCQAKVKPHKVCGCENPLIPGFPTKPSWWKDGWQTAEQRNLVLVENTTQPLDVVLFGDSITEHWLGTDFGVQEPMWQGHEALYPKLFSKPDGAAIEGLALGIGGDRTRHLLYRVMNRELADHIQPSVFWVLIGTNDLDGGDCNKDQITAGTIRIVQEILEHRPQATVVVNSILLHAFLSDGAWGDWDNVFNPVNQRMACFAESHDRVEFFNATDLFLNKTSSERYPNVTLFQGSTGRNQYFDKVHPSVEGNRVWGEAIVTKVQEILQRRA